MKKIIASVLAVLTVAGSMSVVPMRKTVSHAVNLNELAKQEHTQTEGKLSKTVSWKLDEDGTLTISGEGSMIPRSKDGLERDYTGYDSYYIFWCDTRIKKVIIEEGITDLSELFWDCSELESVSLPESLKEIYATAFYGDCKKLTDINIPEGVEHIGRDAFGASPWLKQKRKENDLVIVNNIMIDILEYLLSHKNDIDKHFDIPDGVKSFSGEMFDYHPGNSYDDFYYKNIESVSVPESVTTLPPLAFCGDNLKEVVLPDTLKKIEYYAFESDSIESVVIPKDVEYIANDAFVKPDENKIDIYVYKDSYAESWAAEHGYEYGIVDEKGRTLAGDANCNGEIEISDAVLIMQSIANPEKYSTYGYANNRIKFQGAKNGDVSGNDGITNLDAVTIQSYVLNLIDSFD